MERESFTSDTIMTMAPEYVVSHSGVRGTPGTFQNIGAVNDALTIESTQRVKSKANTFAVKVANPIRYGTGFYKYQDIFEPDDELGIKLGQGFASGNVPLGPQLDMLGIVKSFDYDMSDKGNFLIVKGDDLSTKTLDFIVQRDYSSGTVTASQIITEVMEDLNGVLPDSQKLTLQITPSPVGSTVAIDMKIENRRARDLLDELSIDTNTYDGNYTYGVVSSGGERIFYWKPKPTTVDRQIDMESEVYSFRPSKSVYNIKNFLYINCGNDGSGNSIWTYIANFQSIADVGWKADVYPQVYIAEELKGLGFSGTLLFSKAKERGQVTGKKQLELLSHPSWKAEFEQPGTISYNLDNFLYVYSRALGGDWAAVSPEINPSTGSNYQGFKLRASQIKKEFSTKGYFTTVEVVQDLELA